MADNETKVVISGDASGASQAMDKAAEATHAGTERIKSSLGGLGGMFQMLLGHMHGMAQGAGEHTAKVGEAVEGMGGRINAAVGGIKGSLNAIGEGFGAVAGVFGTLAAVVAGGAFFKEAINESNQLTGEVMKLARTLGMSAEEAGTLNSALGIIGTDADTYTGTFQRFTMQLRRNEDGIRDMGVETRDANGHLRDANEVFTEALKVVNQYKPGIDQTAAAQKLFGRSVDDVMKLQKLNNSVLEEAKEKNEALGLVVTQQNVEASKKYKLAMHDVKEVLEAVMKTIGDAVMPIFTELAQYLASTGPTVVNIFRGALTGLMLVFRTLQATVKTVAAVIFEFLSHTMDQISNLGTLIDDVLHGRWKKAGDDVVAMKDRSVQAFVNIKDAAVDNFKEASNAFSNDLSRLWDPKVAASGPTTAGKKQMGDLKDQKQKAPSRMGQWEAELEEQKVAYEKAHDLREMDKADEEAFWVAKSKTGDLSLEEQTALRKKIGEEQLAIMKDTAKKEEELEQESIAARQKMGLAVIDQQRAEAQARVDLGIMTNGEMIKEEQKLEDERFRVVKEGIDARLALLEKDPTKNVVALRKLNDELDAAEQEHLNKQRGLEIKGNQEMVKDYQDAFNKIGNAFQTVVQGLMTHQMTWTQAVKSMFQSTMSAIAGFIAQYIEKRLAAFAIEKALNLAGITGDAAKAGSGAAASQASIPYVGPVLALAAMAAVFAATIGMQSNVKSARGGYDIPSGVNPMVQTHEEEMILPKEQANAVRDMAKGGSGGVSINATPMPGGFWMMHQDEIVKVMKHAQRYGRF